MKKIELTKGFKALVDDDDFDKLNKLSWHYQPKRKTGYAIGFLQVHGKKSTRRMHRYILNAKTGQQIDHINGNGLDNRKSNLRIATAKQNATNRRSKPSSGYKGVTKVYTNKNGIETFMCRIGPKKNHKIIGYFKTAIEAARAYDEEAKKLYGEFAATNFIGELK